MEAAWSLVVRDADAALAVDATNFKASFRRARALFEMGELDDAFVDATKVVEHYAQTSSTPNPDATALREQIQDAIRAERSKWGKSQKAARWNRAKHSTLVEDVNNINSTDLPIPGRPQFRMPWEDTLVKPVATPSRRVSAPAAPRNGGDVEKALLVTLKDPDSQLHYIQEHLSPAAVRKFWARCPLGADLLGLIVRLLAEDSEVPGTTQLLQAIGAAPSTQTLVEMFNREEKAALDKLRNRLDVHALKAWFPDCSE
jgi:hypothetical protein